MHDNYINGEWVGAGETKRNLNPSDTRDVVGEYASGDAVQARQAIDAANNALEAWSAWTSEARADALDRIGDRILADKERLGEMLAREEGKVLAESIGEVTRAGRVFKFFAGEAIRFGGEFIPSVRPGVSVEVSREPVGVVGIITPWNFPIAIPAWKIAPALAYGNSVVFKPADLVPGCAWALASIIDEVGGLPKGVFNLVMGPGSKVGNALVTSQKVSAITFTGSSATGMNIAAECAARGAKFQLEMGGKNPLVVLDDADLELAVSTAINGAFFSTGQRCTSSSRLIVEKGIHDKFVERMREATQALKVGHALNPNTDIGPVASQVQLDQDLRYIDEAKQAGCRLEAGGEQLSLETPGYYLTPALFSQTRNEMPINQEEVFGPVATVIKANDYEHALELANDTVYGLSSGICTQSLARAAHFKRHSSAGMVMVNLPTAGVDYHVPFGGRKGSSYGPREQGSYAKEFFTNVKTSYTLSQGV